MSFAVTWALGGIPHGPVKAEQAGGSTLFTISFANVEVSGSDTLISSEREPAVLATSTADETLVNVSDVASSLLHVWKKPASRPVFSK